MDPQFQELAGEIADAVEKRLSGAFEERIKTHVEEAVDTRLTGNFEDRIASNIEGLSGAFEERIATNIEKRLSGAFEQTHQDTHRPVRAASRPELQDHIDQFEQRAELRMQMHFENLETKVTLAAEGYGATLKKIERELVESEQESRRTIRRSQPGPDRPQPANHRVRETSLGILPYFHLRRSSVQRSRDRRCYRRHAMARSVKRQSTIEQQIKNLKVRVARLERPDQVNAAIRRGRREILGGLSTPLG